MIDNYNHTFPYFLSSGWRLSWLSWLSWRCF